MKRNVRVSRSQLNLQPAFAITGHAAQGKTLTQVLVNLHEGGFAAYVSASRARTREGLFLSRPVNLEDLNRPVSSDLRHECRRLERLEHNTYIRHGFKAGSIMPALDPESEIGLDDFTTAEAPSAAPAITNQSQLPPDAMIAAPSCPRPDSPSRDNSRSTSAGCVWSANSCAYDTFFMTMFAMYRNATVTWRQAFSVVGPWFELLARMFQYLEGPTHLNDPNCFSKCRDDLRALLSAHDTQAFPPPGHCHTSICNVFESFEKNSSCGFTLRQRLVCVAGCQTERDVLCLPNACNSGSWMNSARRTGFSYTQDRASIQLFIDLQIAAKIKQGVQSRCEVCQTNSRTSFVFLPSPSPWLFFKIPSGASPRPETPQMLELRGETGMIVYRLSSVIYCGSTHFTAVWTDKEGSVWSYDGLAYGGQPRRLESVSLETLEEHGGRSSHVALYGLCSTSSS